MQLKNINKERDDYKKQLDKLNSEIAKSLFGESSFTPDQLSTAIRGIQDKFDEASEMIDYIEKELSQEKENYSDVRNMVEELKNWEEKFDAADNDLKK